MDLSKAASTPKTATKLHLSVRSLIQELGFAYDEEHGVEKYSLDFYLPEFHVGVEADGPTHRKNKKEDRARDHLIFLFSGILIYRIDYQDLKLNQVTVKEDLLGFCTASWDSSNKRRISGS